MDSAIRCVGHTARKGIEAHRNSLSGSGRPLAARVKCRGAARASRLADGRARPRPDAPRRAFPLRQVTA